MMSEDVILGLVVLTALAFDFTNGFHDTANAMATSIATRALKPRVAVALSAVLNFAGAFISLKVAATIAEDIVDPSSVTVPIIFAGLVGAITWNLVTWRMGLPSSSSHALIGGVVGAVLVAKGPDAILVDGIVAKVLVPGVVAPILALAVAAVATFALYRLIKGRRPDVIKRGYKAGQIASASLVSLAHGTNDAQKTMGVITLALIAGGHLSGSGGSVDTPVWVIVAAATAISLGTYIGGWRIIRTLGHRITDIEAPQGFAAETSAASVILAASQAGFPLSTTHVTSGSVMGAGVGKKAAAVNWGVAGNMAGAWILTLPAAALVAGGVYLVADALGPNGAGTILMAVVAAAAAAVLFWQAHTRRPVTASDV